MRFMTFHHRRRKKPARRRAVAYMVAGLLGTIMALALGAPSAAASTCYNSLDPYWYARMRTSDNTGSQQNRLGVRGNLTTEGNPYTQRPDDQHVAVWLASKEAVGRWTQVGWIIGRFGWCDHETTIGNTPTVYVEVYDDTDSSCYHALNGSADPNASYETSYYGKVGLQSQYRAYY